MEKSSFKIVPPAEPEVVLTLVMRPCDVKDLHSRMTGYGLFNGAWLAVDGAYDELVTRGLI